MSDLLAVASQGDRMPVPKYERVASAIREQIRSGKLQPGARLPTTRQLEEHYEVSYGSVRTALMILKAEGLIVGRPGEGVYVA